MVEKEVCTTGRDKGGRKWGDRRQGVKEV